MPHKNPKPKLNITVWLKRFSQIWKNFNVWQKIGCYLLAIIIFITGIMYGIAGWYINSTDDEPVEFGVTFIPAYAEYLGVDPMVTMQALASDMGINRFRLVSYWNEIEYSRGEYDFSRLDWQFDLAEEHNADVTLAIGLRQPRWPECHKPEWAKNLPKEQWYPALKDYMAAIINRYSKHPALASYQLENEFHLEAFGVCPNHERERLIDEFQFVKSVDSTKPIIITRSNNATPSWPVGEPRADIVGAAIYKRIWDKYLTNRYFEYPYPPWFYGFLAGATKITTGRDSFIHELQAEPWLPEGYEMKSAPASEMYKSFSPEDVEPRIKYAMDTGMAPIDLWGAEWWYFMKEVRNKPEVWNAVKNTLEKY